MGQRADPVRRLREKSSQAALLAVERLIQLLKDPEAANGDVIKAATLIFDRICPNQQEGGTQGDFDICIKEG